LLLLGIHEHGHALSLIWCTFSVCRVMAAVSTLGSVDSTAA
jgi:hypothetical protein